MKRRKIREGEGKVGEGRGGKQAFGNSWAYIAQFVECLHSMHKALDLIPAPPKLHMMAQSSSPSTWEVAAERSEVQSLLRRKHKDGKFQGCGEAHLVDSCCVSMRT